VVVQGHAKTTKTQIGRIQKNGLSSYYWGYEIEHYCSNGDAFESDSFGSGDHGGGEDGILKAAHTQATSRS